jgi:DNA adenine methylase
MRYESPLRYPGGKARLANYIKALLRTNDLLGAEYVEPYAGGASVALALLFAGYTPRIHINDLSRPIAAFWRAVLDHTDDLCRKIRDCRVTVSNYERQRAVLRRPREADVLALGFAAFFVNRTSRSGIIGPRAGLIGGKEQDGEWKIDARFGRAGLIERVEAIASRRSQISVYNMDALRFLSGPASRLSAAAFVYLDPPYYRKGQRLYQNYYGHDDHASVATLVLGLEQDWVLSYDDTPEVRCLYRGHTSRSYAVPYSAADRYDGREVLFMSARLKSPKISEPARFNDAAFRAWLTRRSASAA